MSQKAELICSARVWSKAPCRGESAPGVSRSHPGTQEEQHVGAGQGPACVSHSGKPGFAPSGQAVLSLLSLKAQVSGGPLLLEEGIPWWEGWRD